MLIDTTNSISPALSTKANLDKNMVGNNWYVENMQAKRDRDWAYRPNLFDIYEEGDKQQEYTTDPVIYTPVEAVIESVYDQKLKTEMSDGWARLNFREFSHPRGLGKRYRFNEDLFHINPAPILTKDQTDQRTSIWLTVNLNKIKLNSSCIVRRCNSNLGFAGSPNLSYDNITEYHYEPCVIDDTEEYVNQYYTSVVPVVSGGVYITMQYNYYTSFIKINDRIIIGGTDTQDLTNNAVYKVKYISKVDANKTFGDKRNKDIDDIDLIIVSLDKDTMSLDDDDFDTRVANRAVLYKVPVEGEKQKTGEYYITLKNYNLPYIFDLYTLDGEQDFYIELIKDGEVQTFSNLICTAQLDGTSESYINYAEVQCVGNNLKVRCKKQNKTNQLIVNLQINQTKQKLVFNLKGAV